MLSDGMTRYIVTLRKRLCGPQHSCRAIAIKPRADILSTALLAIFVLFGSDAKAAPLTEEECAKLDARRQALVTLGVKENMAKGTDWAKSNLSEGELFLIKTYITVLEQLRFRCPTHVFNAEKKDDGSGAVGPNEAIDLPVRKPGREKSVPDKTAEGKEGDSAEQGHIDNPADGGPDKTGKKINGDQSGNPTSSSPKRENQHNELTQPEGQTLRPTRSRTKSAVQPKKRRTGEQIYRARSRIDQRVKRSKTTKSPKNTTTIPAITGALRQQIFEGQ